ncbi:hypothetical protein [Alteromonas sp. a30]|uniref:hypothetical protein n=1 Tax=Alteromonas sp. a30 TaxID=2730917 RepID=UPI00227E7270|nr:hypothetical protein [Alteromonas sp. a30]MCY7297487.1 hypothetical protein [Alteromonas sp. a30]
MLKAGAKVKIKLTTHDGNSFGYLALGTGKNRKFFLGGATEGDATLFVLEKYKKANDIFYYRIDGTKKTYLDEHTDGGEVFPEKPFISVDNSTIHAWQLNDEGHLEAVYLSTGTTEVLAEPHNRTQLHIREEHPNAVFCNFEKTSLPYAVEIIEQ